MSQTTLAGGAVGGAGSPPSEQRQNFFDKFACRAAEYAGKASTFALAAALLIGWAVTGPFFGFSEAWQLVVNTGTTIITFLMVFVIQHAQNRDTAAVQLKLSELIVAVREADNKIAAADMMSEEEIKAAKQQVEARAKEETA